MQGRRRSLEERAALVREFRSSAQTQAEFSKRKGISVETLKNWLKLDRRSVPFVEVTVADPKPSRTEVALEFPDGTVLRIRG